MEKTQESVKEIQKENKILKGLSPEKVIIPVLIGLGFAAWMLYSDITQNNLIANFRQPNWFWLGMALLALIIRDGVYMYRIRHLSKKALSWLGSFYIIVLWEFSSAISPTAVGGTAVASFLLMKEGISFGKSLAYVIVTAILDNLFFLIVGGIVIILNFMNFFPNGIFYLDSHEVPTGTSDLLRITFYTSYSVIFAYNLLMMYGLFSKPEAIKWLFIKLTSFSFLKRFKKAAEHQGDELVIASRELKGISAMYWIKASVATVLIWCSRYLIVNCLIAAFFVVSGADHGLIFSRHVILWVILIIAITPGGAGIAEYAFKGFYAPFAGVMTGFISILWRMITYYPYLIGGVVFLPRWIKRVFFDKVSPQEPEKQS